MRRLRPPFITSGRVRSPGVIELMIDSICTKDLSLAFSLICDVILPIPGILSIIDIMPPILRICSSCSLKSCKSKPLPFCTFLASFCALSLSTLRSTSSIKVSTSPIPKIREAIRSG